MRSLLLGLLLAVVSNTTTFAESPPSSPVVAIEPTKRDDEALKSAEARRRMGKWACSVHNRVAKLMDVALTGSKEGRHRVSFKITETGELTAISVEGEQSLYRRAEAVLQAAGMPVSPDRNPHTFSVMVNVIAGKGVDSACAPACS